jgi:WD40 repeat protein
LATDFYGGITLRDAQEGNVLRSFPGHAGGSFPGVRPAPQVCFSSDGERILSNGDDHTVRLWNSTNAEELKKLAFSSAKKRFIALSPDAKQALISQDSDVQIWDMDAGKSIHVLKGHKDHVTAVAYAPDGAWAVSASQDKTLRVWDVATGKEHAILEGHTDDVTCLAITSDGTILSGSRDKTLRVWPKPK